MITASIVTYKQSIDELRGIISDIDISCIARSYIIDNSPTPDIQNIDQLSNKISYKFLDKNVGFGAGHNIAIRLAIQDSINSYHIVLNPDIRFSTGTIETLLSYSIDNEDVGLIMPKILYPNGQTQFLAKMLPHPIDWIGRRFIPVKQWVHKRNSRFEMRDSGYNKAMVVPYLSGCFMFLRISVLQKVGLFDERIFMYGEDTDLTRRIHRNFKTVFFPDVIAYHVHKKDSYKSFKLLLIHIQSAIYYFNKWGWFYDKERSRINKDLLKYLF